MKSTKLFAIALLALFTACGSNGDLSTSAAEKAYNCIGNEPFWNVKVEASGIRFQLAGEDAVTYPYKAASRQGAAQVFETTMQSSRLKVSITQESCSDGMSDTQYPYK